MLIKNKATRYLFRLFTFIFIMFVILTGCQKQKLLFKGDKAPLPEIKRLVVIGFMPAMSQGDKAAVVRNPLSGALFQSEPVPYSRVSLMTNRLFEMFVKESGFDLISPNHAKGVFSSLISSNMAIEDRKIFPKIGQVFSSEAVLLGYIYRWKERQGSDYAVNRPASVAFDLYLIKTSDGGILWKGKFDKTQRSLSENLLDMQTFFDSGGKWMTAEKLADLGLKGLFEKIPKKKKEKED